MRRLTTMTLVLLGVASSSTVLASPYSAPVRAKSWDWELYGGLYRPTPEPFENEATGGLRISWNATDRAAVRVQLGYADATQDFTLDLQEPVSGTLEIDLGVVDVGLAVLVNPQDRLVASVYAGPGWAFVSSSGLVEIPGSPAVFVPGIEDDSFTGHGGAAVEYFISPSFFLRGAAAFRWFEARSDNEVDSEFTIGIGFMQFGPQR